MKLLLRLTAVVALAWAIFLLVLKQQAIAPADLSPQLRAVANGLGIANLVLAYVFWRGARQPANDRGAVYAAILLMVLKAANDLYELLALLPPAQAAISLADLVISVALLVGILEALPRTLKSPTAQ